MQKPILLFGNSAAIAELAKAQIAGYTRKDGTYVAEHTDKRQAAAPKQTGKASGQQAKATKQPDEQYHRAQAASHDEAILAAYSQDDEAGAKAHVRARDHHKIAADFHREQDPDAAAEWGAQAHELSKKAHEAFPHKATPMAKSILLFRRA